MRPAGGFPDFRECLRVVPDAVGLRHGFPVGLAQEVEDGRRGLFEIDLTEFFHEVGAVDGIAERDFRSSFLLPGRGVHGEGIHRGEGRGQRPGFGQDFFRRGRGPGFPEEFPYGNFLVQRDVDEFVVGEVLGDGLPDPPYGVGDEPDAVAVGEGIYRPYEAGDSHVHYVAAFGILGPVGRSDLYDERDMVRRDPVPGRYADVPGKGLVPVDIEIDFLGPVVEPPGLGILVEKVGIVAFLFRRAVLFEIAGHIQSI